MSNTLDVGQCIVLLVYGVVEWLMFLLGFDAPDGDPHHLRDNVKKYAVLQSHVPSFQDKPRARPVILKDRLRQYSFLNQLSHICNSQHFSQNRLRQLQLHLHNQPLISDQAFTAITTDQFMSFLNHVFTNCPLWQPRESSGLFIIKLLDLILTCTGQYK